MPARGAGAIVQSSPVSSDLPQEPDAVPRRTPKPTREPAPEPVPEPIPEATVGELAVTVVGSTVRLPMRLARFAWRVLVEFARNRGFLLAGALGYNTLLSIVPLLALVVVVLSTVVDHNALLSTINGQVEALLPGRGAVLTEAFAAFVEQRATIGIVGFAVLLFFSAVAFRMLDDAFAVVFHRNRRVRQSHWLRSFALPLAYVLLIGVAILALTLVMIAFEALPEQGVRWLGIAWEPELATTVAQLLAFVGLVLLLGSFYWVMPLAHVHPRSAAIGGFVAATLWEGVRSLMVWYFANLSLVDLVYGSLGTVIVLLLGLEVAAIILLLGAQVIAELERAKSLDLKWFETTSED
jgi:YihY family inner membrane protein